MRGFPEFSKRSVLVSSTILSNDSGSFQSPTVQKYVIGGKLFASKSAGAMTLKLKNKYIPIISFTAVSCSHFLLWLTADI